MFEAGATLVFLSVLILALIFLAGVAGALFGKALERFFEDTEDDERR